MTDSQKQKKRRNKAYSDNTKILDHRTNLRFNFREVFEMTLCLLSWLKRKEFWNRGDKKYEEYVKQSINTLIIQLNEINTQG